MASQPPAEAPASTESGAGEVAQVDESAGTNTQQPHPADEVKSSTSMAQPSDTKAERPSASEQPAPVLSTAQQPPSSSEEKQGSAPRPSSPTLTRKQTEALGPATDEAITAPISTSAGPALNINLMLTTGAKHPYKIDEKYLSNRNTTAKAAGTGDFDPKQLTGYKLKELIWTDWRKEWEPRPSSPSMIRLITMGKMIDDKKTLNDYSFDMAKTNVVHMTVRPSDFGEDEETAGKHGKGGSIRTRDGGEGGAGCRCVIL